MTTPLKIAIIGSGKIGGTLGARWAVAGHTVVYGVRDPASAKAQQAQQGSAGAQLKSIPDALAQGDVVLLAIPGAAMPEFMAHYGAAVDGKIVMDATNRFSEQVMNALPVIQQYAPHARVFRVFNSLGWEVFAESTIGGIQADHFYAGPDTPDRTLVEDLVRAIGLNPIYVGGPQTFHWVDALGGLFGALAHGQKRGRHLALKLLTD